MEPDLFSRVGIRQAAQADFAVCRILIKFAFQILFYLKSNVKNIAILGSTGSIGTQTLDIVEAYPELFRVGLLTAGSNARLLAEQARKFLPARVVIADEGQYAWLRDELAGLPVDVAAGQKAIAEAAAESDTDTVVTAMVGYSGLPPTLGALEEGKTIALANKETLVAGGEIVTRLARSRGADIVPVDSEHSAIFQCLQGEFRAEMKKIILTASGGPFRTRPAEEIRRATAAEALRHPNWSMGAKVTVDSASMMNKGFEMIEARWLFDCPPERIQIVVHPQSIVHSMVEFADGCVMAQLGVPDMHLPIRYALSHPHRLKSELPPLTLAQYASLTFEEPDLERFPMLGYAFEAIAEGGSKPCTLNAANEVAVAAFLRGEILFGDMPRIVRATLDAMPRTGIESYSDLEASDREARAKATEILKQLTNT